jgi:hypothetical protein
MKTIQIKFRGRREAINVRKALNDPNWFCRPLQVI